MKQMTATSTMGSPPLPLSEFRTMGDAITDLSNACSRVGDLSSLLRERLSPALNPETPSVKSASAIEEKASTNSPLVDSLSILAQTISANCNHIETTISLLSL